MGTHVTTYRDKGPLAIRPHASGLRVVVPGTREITPNSCMKTEKRSQEGRINTVRHLPRVQPSLRQQQWVERKSPRNTLCRGGRVVVYRVGGARYSRVMEGTSRRKSTVHHLFRFGLHPPPHGRCSVALDFESTDLRSEVLTDV